MMWNHEKGTHRASRFRETFSNRHVILPVIHVCSQSQAWENVQVAREAGADGAFLINHGVSSSELLDIHRATHKRIPDWWLGVNCLDLCPEEALRATSADVAGIWADNAPIDENNREQPEADRIEAARHKAGGQDCTSAAWPSSTSVRSKENVKYASAVVRPHLLPRPGALSARKAS